MPLSAEFYELRKLLVRSNYRHWVSLMRMKADEDVLDSVRAVCPHEFSTETAGKPLEVVANAFANISRTPKVWTSIDDDDHTVLLFGCAEDAIIAKLALG